ncbi:MAG: hypothetical protein KAJ54_00470 [Candidatus Aenigmarchaeota archaeon]|nr:hypothetical protein [Candidatus Aenigmarchaeota archaeon]
MVSRNSSYRKKEKYKEIALERIYILFSEAGKVFREDCGLAKRYVQLARKIAMRIVVPIPKELKPLFCRKCSEYLVYGVNAKQRLDSKNKVAVYTCLSCGNERRIPYYPLRKGKTFKGVKEKE